MSDDDLFERGTATIVGLDGRYVRIRSPLPGSTCTRPRQRRIQRCPSSLQHP